MKILSWLIALCGLWEFGDIAALFVPGFGSIPIFVWNHIVVGILLLISGIWAAQTNNASTAKTMNWIVVAAGIWLIIGSSILRHSVVSIGLWNDIIIGIIVVILGMWAALSSPRISG